MDSEKTREKLYNLFFPGRFFTFGLGSHGVFQLVAEGCERLSKAFTVSHFDLYCLLLLQYIHQINTVVERNKAK